MKKIVITRKGLTKKPFLVLIVSILFLILVVTGTLYAKYNAFSRNIYKQDAILLKKEDAVLTNANLPYKEFNDIADEVITSRNKLINSISNQNIVLFNSKLQTIKKILNDENEKFKTKLMNNSEYALQISGLRLYTKMENHYVWYSKKELQKDFLLKYAVGLSDKEIENLKDGYSHNEPYPGSKRISFILINKSDREFSNIVIKLAVYKNINNQIGTFTINVENLQPHKTTKIDELLPVKFWDAIGFTKNPFHWDLKAGDINFVGDKDAPPYIDESADAGCEVVKISGE